MRTLRIDVHLGPDDVAAQLREEARAGLTSVPKELQPKWFYDERGSALFERITRLPEYYPTRREREILLTRADEIARRTGADALVELGSGTSEKTRVLLDALTRAGTLRRFVPFDVSEQTLRDAAAAVDGEYPGVEVHAVVGDFDHHLREIPDGGNRLIAFLGGTIGNFTPAKRAAFLSDIAADMHDGDALLCGTDLVKDVSRLEAAYDDAAGVTAEFNRNVLHVLNRELAADFDPDAFEHVARFDRDQERIEMLLRSSRSQIVHLAELDLDVAFEANEEMRTETSAKFRHDGWSRELADAGLQLDAFWTDDAGDFALTLATPASARVPLE